MFGRHYDIKVYVRLSLWSSFESTENNSNTDRQTTLAHCPPEKPSYSSISPHHAALRRPHFTTPLIQYPKKGVIPLVMAFYSVFTVVDTFPPCYSLKWEQWNSRESQSGTDRTVARPADCEAVCSLAQSFHSTTIKKIQPNPPQYCYSHTSLASNTAKIPSRLYFTSTLLQ